MKWIAYNYIVFLDKYTTLRNLLEMLRYSGDRVLNFNDNRILLLHERRSDSTGDLFHDSCGILARWKSFGFKVRELKTEFEKSDWNKLSIEQEEP